MSGTAPVRVVVVDDAVEIRELLELALARETDFAVVAEAADGAAGSRRWPRPPRIWCCWTSACL